MLSVYDAIFLEKLSRSQLTEQLATLLGFSAAQLTSIYSRAPADVNVDVTDNVSSFCPTPESLISHAHKIINVIWAGRSSTLASVRL